eukprot:Sspe_Gene.87667::Locus_59290_Transcript_1_1_Confidence_1.000_Length_394::g.87667::m.87667
MLVDRTTRENYEGELVVAVPREIPREKGCEDSGRGRKTGCGEEGVSSVEGKRKEKRTRSPAKQNKQDIDPLVHFPPRGLLLEATLGKGDSGCDMCLLSTNPWVAIQAAADAWGTTRSR